MPTTSFLVRPALRSGVRRVALLDPDGTLPGARAEGAWLADLDGYEVWFGPEATRDRLSDGMALLHLACHSRHAPEHPLLSRAELANTATDNGTLTLLDVLWMNRAPEIVVLHGCDSAAAAAAGGSEWLAFAEAWLAAGSRAVVGSRWQLEDGLAHRAARVLHEALNAGEDIGSACRAAVLAVRAEAPAILLWAPITLFGDPGTQLRRYRSR